MALLSVIQDTVYANPLGIASAALLVYVFGWIVYSRYFHPLAGVPGPLLASITRLWYVKKVRDGNFDYLARRLHCQYGYLVRIAPDEVSVSDPAALKTIYGVSSGFTKTDFYLTFRTDAFESDEPDPFSNLDEKSHSARRKKISATYSMSSVLDGEQYIDACTRMLIDRLGDFAKSKESVDLGVWLQMYAFDIIGELFFNRMLGFMETKSDVHGLIQSLNTVLPVLATASVMNKSLRGLVFLSGLIFPSVRDAIKCLGKFEDAAKEQVKKRQELMEKQVDSRRDLLAKLFSVHFDKSKAYPIGQLGQEVHGAMFAGSDTTGIALTVIVHNIISHPLVYDRLMKEIDEAVADGRASMPITYAQATKLPYFSACCREAMRLQPSVGLTLPRYVPKGGREISGRFFAEGTKIGVNASVVQHDESIFGKDASQFNPDRWLRTDAAIMDRHMLQFGIGSRTCLGKHVSLAEIWKVLPALLYEYRIEFADQNQRMVDKHWWFNKKSDFVVRLSKRR